jgi:hypothetical protein
MSSQYAKSVFQQIRQPPHKKSLQAVNLQACLVSGRGATRSQKLRSEFDRFLAENPLKLLE